MERYLYISLPPDAVTPATLLQKWSQELELACWFVFGL